MAAFIAPAWTPSPWAQTTLDVVAVAFGLLLLAAAGVLLSATLRLRRQSAEMERWLGEERARRTTLKEQRAKLDTEYDEALKTIRAGGRRTALRVQ